MIPANGCTKLKIPVKVLGPEWKNADALSVSSQLSMLWKPASCQRDEPVLHTGMAFAFSVSCSGSTLFVYTILRWIISAKNLSRTYGRTWFPWTSPSSRVFR